MRGERRPRLALTLGDPAGIGPEVVLRALADAARPPADWLVYGPVASLRERSRLFSLPSPETLGVELVDVPGDIVGLGRVSAEGGRVAAQAVQRAAKDALAGRVDGLVTPSSSRTRPGSRTWR
jgi:4-hydroxy-L-threonine phosphate dehydrogenase PdxA